MPCCTQASPAWGGKRFAQHAIARLSRDTPGHRFVWQRCAAVLGKWLMPPDRADAQPFESRSPGREGARSPPAPKVRDTGRIAASPMNGILMVACRLPLETSVFPPPAIYRL